MNKSGLGPAPHPPHLVPGKEQEIVEFQIFSECFVQLLENAQNLNSNI